MDLETVQKGFFAFYKSVVQSMNSAGYGILTFVKRREVRSVKNGGIWLILMLFCLAISLASWQREAADVSGETEIALEEKYIPSAKAPPVRYLSGSTMRCLRSKA